MTPVTRENNKKEKPSQPGQSRSERLIGQIRDAVQQEFKSEYARRHTLSTYASKLEEADKEVTTFIQTVIKETKSAYRTTLWLYAISHGIGILLLFSGFFLVWEKFQERVADDSNLVPLTIGCFVAGIIVLIIVQGRNPIRNLRYMVDNLAKLNVVFVGFIRQVNQIDAVFEDMFAAGKNIDANTAEQMLDHIQDAMAEAMNAISHISSYLVE